MKKYNKEEEIMLSDQDILRDKLPRFIQVARAGKFDSEKTKRHFSTASVETVVWILNTIYKAWSPEDGELRYYNLQYGIKTPDTGVESRLIDLWRFFVNKMAKLGVKKNSDNVRASIQNELISMIPGVRLSAKKRENLIAITIGVTPSKVPNLLKLSPFDQWKVKIALHDAFPDEFPLSTPEEDKRAEKALLWLTSHDNTKPSETTE